MKYLNRHIEIRLQSAINRGKSVLLLSARQTGKNSLLKNQFKSAIYYNLSSSRLRREFEQDPDRLADENKGTSGPKGRQLSVR